MCCCCCVAASLGGVLAAILLVCLTIWIAPYLLALTSGLLPQFGPFFLVFSFAVSVSCSLALSCFISKGTKKEERKAEDNDDGVNTGGRPGRPGLCRERCQPSYFIRFLKYLNGNDTSSKPSLTFLLILTTIFQVKNNVVWVFSNSYSSD